MFTSGGGDPQSPRTGQRPGTAARVLHGVGTERQPVVGRPVQTRRTLPHPAALWARGEGGAAAVLVAAQLAVADPAEAGDQSGWWSARGSSRRAHQGRHRRERRSAARRGNCSGRSRRQQRQCLPDSPGGHPGRPVTTWTRGSRAWIRADSLGSVDMDEAAARGHRRLSLHQGAQRG
jgi:hypothetical protein